MLTIIGYWWCWLWHLGQHEYLIVRSPEKLDQVCVHCGHQTEGWILSPATLSPINSWARHEFVIIRQELEAVELTLHGGG